MINFGLPHFGVMAPPWTHPFTCVVAGPTQCGKTWWVKRFLQNAHTLITPTPERIIWCYGIWQEEFLQMEHLVSEWVEGIPDLSNIDPSKRHLVIIDDLMAETDSRVTNIFTKASHHRNISVVYLVQNLFHKGKEQRTISLNSHYLVLFKNPRDNNQITHLAKQMHPGNTKFLQEAFADATAMPYGYLILDLKQNTPEKLRIYTSIFPNEYTQIYIKKGGTW